MSRTAEDDRFAPSSTQSTSPPSSEVQTEAGQYDAGTRLSVAPGGRSDFIAGAIRDVGNGTAEPHPFLDRMSTRLATHDDREQFDAGLDMLVAGIEATTGARLARG